MNKINVIAIDGPSASGKGALTRKIAYRYGFDILDSGLLYRIYAFLANSRINTDKIKEKITNDISFELSEEKILVDGVTIRCHLRSRQNFILRILPLLWMKLRKVLILLHLKK